MSNKHKPRHHEKPRPEHLKSDEIKIHGSVQVFHTEEANKQEAERSDAKTYKSHTQWYENKSVLIASVVAVITALYFVATLLILIETRRANRNVQENAHLDQRAWMGMESMDGTPVQYPETGKQFGVKIVFRNSGKTPAKNILMWSGVEIFPSVPHVNDMCVIARTKEESKTVLAPNATYTIPLEMTQGKALDHNWEQALSAKGGFIYTYGCVLYEDIFERRHWFTYCARASKTGFQACKTYNDTGDGDPPR
jgi:hypothetical protein